MTTEGDLSDIDLFNPLPNVDENAHHRLRAQLAADAGDAGILDVAYRTVETPYGELLLAATERGLVRVAYPHQSHARVLHQLANAVSPRVLRAPARLDRATQEIEEYLSGQRTRFDLRLDFQLASGFRHAVLNHLTGIAYGATTSYAAVAAAAGNPKAARAVGTACATNPLPIVVPCHRVLRSDGTIGGYAGGTGTKHALLALEGTVRSPC